MPVEPIPTPSAPPAAGPYSSAVRAGPWVVLAGQVGLDPSTGTLVEGGAAGQATRVLANVTAVLGDCGASLTDVAKANVYLTNLADFAAVNAVYAAVFAGHRPARTTVGVASLPLGAAVEIEVWAYVGDKPSPA